MSFEELSTYRRQSEDLESTHNDFQLRKDVDTLSAFNITSKKKHQSNLNLMMEAQDKILTYLDKIIPKKKNSDGQMLKLKENNKSMNTNENRKLYNRQSHNLDKSSEFTDTVSEDSSNKIGEMVKISIKDKHEEYGIQGSNRNDP